jgi:uncharacterized protein (TIGR02147 family)
MATAMPAPEIYDFLDYRKFLIAWFAWMKTAYPRYSHRAFARKAGQSSPSLLLSVMDGKRNLTPATTEGFLKALGLDAEAGRFFVALVAFEQAETELLRSAAWEQVRATQRFREARQLNDESVQYLSRWYIPAVREFAACAGFKPDPGWLATRMRPRITAEQAQEALDVLRALGMLVVRDGQTVAAEGSLVTPHEVAGMAALNYHVGMLDRAREALLKTPSTERHFCAVTVSIPPALLPELKRELDQIQERLLERCAAAEGVRRVVYQLNLSLFPLTESSE